MLTPRPSKRRAFTLVEIMIVVAIIAILASIGIPNYLRARKRAQATRIIEDLRIIDSAVEQYALETGKIAGFNPGFADLKNYMKTGSQLYTMGTDLFGQTYSPFTVDSIPKVNSSTFNALSDVTDPSFWSPYH
jgi:prepilin-type N-terminal cleavage/methylation domain-containing protein